PGAGSRSGAREAFAHRERREFRAMEREEDLECAVEAVEFVLEEIDRRDSGGDPVLRWRVGEQGEAGEGFGRVVELAAPDRDLAGKRKGADVVRLEHHHV